MWRFAIEGWVKLHRKLLESKHGKNPELMGIWIYLLLMANHRDGYTADGTKINAGQFMTSQKKLAANFGIDRISLRRKLLILKNAHQIELQTSNKNTIITITNWHLYQGSEHQDEHQVNIKRTSSEHQVNTNKNEKNEKNEKNIYLADRVSVINYLNSVLNKKFSSNSKYSKLIDSRLSEGYSVKDCKNVIDNKIRSWGSDPVMQKYLRPETLFGNKFDSYLNEVDKNDLIENMILKMAGDCAKD